MADPLHQRQRLLAHKRQARPHYATSNPRYHQILTRCPDLDDSLPGAAWLQSVYFGNQRDGLVLPGVLAALRTRQAGVEAQCRKPEAPAQPQGDLFAEVAA